MNRLVLALSAVTGGLSAALVPVLAVLLLPVDDYGTFALVFLVFAEGWSILLSAVADTWARVRAAGSSAGSWADYTGALAAVGAVAGVVTLAVGWPVLGSGGLAATMAVAVTATLYRQGARYHHAVEHGVRAVLPSDAVAVVVLVAVLAALLLADRSLLTSLLVAWAVSAVAAAALFTRGALRGGGPVGWYRRNRRTVRVLLGESLLMDAGATGTPVLVAPVLGLYDFGVYRSVSSLSVPIQLLIDPVRPLISQVSLRRLATARVAGGLLAVATALTVVGYLALEFVVPAVLSFSPVLSALSDFAVPCGLFIGLQFLTYVLGILARMRVAHRRLLVGRAVHTVFAIALPLLGAVLGSASGAIWGFVVSTGMTVVIWTALLVGAARGPDPAPAAPPQAGTLVPE
ncbi:hypothetical protein DQ240_02655 [Blastococcus sp. TF02A-26]|nr:hypothetical protein DQ240_02655 [Blastococcus sp. TF02A-26]